MLTDTLNNDRVCSQPHNSLVLCAASLTPSNRMAYNAVSQNDHDAASNGSDSDASESSPLPKTSFEPLSIDFDNLGGSLHMNTAKPEKAPSISLQSVIRSRGASTTSYDMLEDDDYHAVDPDRTLNRDCHVKGAEPGQPARATVLAPINTTKPPSPVLPEPILRSPTTDGPALCHPTPDLQALQGAYVGNVVRLEESAERLSLALESRDEIGPLDLGQSDRPPLGSPVHSLSSRSRQASVGSRTGPVGTRSGVGSPIIGSPRRSMPPSPSSQAAAVTRLRSGSIAARLANVIEPEHEDQPVNSEQPSSIPPTISPPPNPPSPNRHPSVTPEHHEENMGLPVDEIERPGSAGSTDTYRQATNLFKDFDGVHFTPHNEPDHSRHVSLNRPPLASLPQAHDEPAPGENMVYYPAPVPMVLNLPQRLSRKTVVNEQEKRRTQLLGSMPADKRKSAPWLPTKEEEVDGQIRQSKRASQLPAQLRASAFFDQPPTHLDITVKDHSAVATLDSILDAAALAPVSAFTDHPIVGHVGADIYGKPKAKKRSKIEKKRHSEHALAGEGFSHSRSDSEHRKGQVEGDIVEGEDEATPFRRSYDRDGEDSDEYVVRQDQRSDGSESDADEDEDENDGSDDEDHIDGPPTTLLAELQMRKREQKQRNRTAANAFPNGMHSTLLELDAVAQRQRENRNHKHVTLAWEDPELADRREPDDDDVPLALLFPEKIKQADENRPLGLMEKLELEENEPLSRRRARIRGEHLPTARQYSSGIFPPPPPANNRASTAFTLDIAGLDDNNDNESDEEETLAQRVRRLKAKEEEKAASGAPGSDFASELLSRFGDDIAPSSEKPDRQPHVDDESPEEEETLAQRRQRLQAAAASGKPSEMPAYNKVANRRSLADVLQAHPIGLQQPQQQQYPPPPASTHGLMYPSGTGNGMPSPAAASRHSLLSLGGNRTTSQRVPLNGPLVSLGTHDIPGNQNSHNNGRGLIAPGTYGNGLSAVTLNPHFYVQQGHRPSPQGQAQAPVGPVIDQGQMDMIDRWRLGVQ